jgi:hypothetical protein
MSFSAYAETYYIDQHFTMPLNCTNPTDREDGTPLLLSEILEIEINIYRDMEIHTVSMAGGCHLLDFDLTQLSPGAWNKEYMTRDTGGRVSAIVQGDPFEYILFVANPNPPTIIEP